MESQSAEQGVARGSAAQIARSLEAAIATINDQDRRGRVVAIVARIFAKRQVAFARAAAGLASPRAAIKAKCQECCGYEDLVPRIRDCTVNRCPLWAYRPYQAGDEDESE